jgi:hypothetical protein
MVNSKEALCRASPHPPKLSIVVRNLKPLSSSFTSRKCLGFLKTVSTVRSEVMRSQVMAPLFRPLQAPTPESTTTLHLSSMISHHYLLHVQSILLISRNWRKRLPTTSTRQIEGKISTRLFSMIMLSPGRPPPGPPPLLRRPLRRHRTRTAFRNSLTCHLSSFIASRSPRSLSSKMLMLGSNTFAVF